MSVFNDYSNYYDLLYSDKDYQAEADYIDHLIQKNNPGSKTILNLGCGTGKHDFLLAEKGYTITAIDLSPTMIEIAKANNVSANINFLENDVRDFHVETKFDAVISLFHVMSYQTENKDLSLAFQTAQKHLKSDGVFIFDCWYGPGVLADPPKHKTKEVENENLRIFRKTSPIMHEEQNCVDVVFDITITDKQSSQEFKLSELHKMRYLFVPEIENIANQTNLKLLEFSKWMSNQKPQRGDWYIVNILKNAK
jgi:SAM-dependent methyltransferase